MKSTVEVSVIIPNHNRVDALPLTLEALNRQTYSSDQFEVILVDQASTDGSREFIRNYSPQYSIRLVEQDGKFGPAIARNCGVDAAIGSLLIFLDSDIIADPGLVEAHVDMHNSQTKAVLACGRVFPYPGMYNTFVERAANPEAGLDRGTDREDFPFHWVFSNHLSLKRGSFEDIGPFHPGLRSFEDIEFGYRALLKGYGIKNCKQAIGYHHHPRTLAERCEQARSYNRNLPYVYQQYPTMQGLMPDLRPFEPIHWREDGWSGTVKKVLARAYGTVLMRKLFFRACNLLETFPFSKPAAKFFYYRLIQGYGYMGYQEGKKTLNQSIPV